MTTLNSKDRVERIHSDILMLICQSALTTSEQRNHQNGRLAALWEELDKELDRKPEFPVPSWARLAVRMVADQIRQNIWWYTHVDTIKGSVR